MANFIALSAKESEEVYRDLVKMKRPLQIQMSEQKIQIQGKVVGRESGEVFFQVPHISRFEGSHTAIITFALPPEIFFLKAKVTGGLGKYYFRETPEVFRLQRRENFRLSIPDRVEAEVDFGKLGKFRLYDISQGGLGIVMATKTAEQFSSGEHFKVRLVLDGEKFEGLELETRHSRVMVTDRAKKLVGFQFSKLGPKNEETLFRLITDLARTHFRS